VCAVEQALTDVIELSLVAAELVMSAVELALIDVVELSLLEAELVASAVELALGDVVGEHLLSNKPVRNPPLPATHEFQQQ
jgi:hypothetical protein